MMGPLTLAPLVIALPLALPLAAAPEAAARRHTLVVDFAAADADTNDGWFARALEQRLIEELSRFQRVSFVEKVDASRCPERRPQCLVRAYTGLADVLVLGRLADERLHYEAYETWTRTSAFRGSLGLGAGVTSGRLQHLMGDIVRPIVQSGGLLDRKPPPAQPPPSEPQRTAARPARARVLSLAIGLGAVFFLALPILIALLLVRPARISKLPRPASWAYSVPLLAALSLLVVVQALAHALPVTHQLPGELRRLLAHPAADLLGHLAGGVLWAGFGLVTLGLLLPRSLRHRSRPPRQPLAAPPRLAAGGDDARALAPRLRAGRRRRALAGPVFRPRPAHHLDAGGAGLRAPRLVLAVFTGGQPLALHRQAPDQGGALGRQSLAPRGPEIFPRLPAPTGH